MKEMVREVEIPEFGDEGVSGRGEEENCYAVRVNPAFLDVPKEDLWKQDIVVKLLVFFFFVVVVVVVVVLFLDLLFFIRRKILVETTSKGSGN